MSTHKAHKAERKAHRIISQLLEDNNYQGELRIEVSIQIFTFNIFTLNISNALCLMHMSH